MAEMFLDKWCVPIDLSNVDIPDSADILRTTERLLQTRLLVATGFLMPLGGRQAVSGH